MFNSKKVRTFAAQLRNKHRGVEQLVARWAHNPKVVCSSQASATKKLIKHRGVEQLVARWAHNPKVVCSSQASATKIKRFQMGSLFLFVYRIPTNTPLNNYTTTCWLNKYQQAGKPPTKDQIFNFPKRLKH